jgi:hypothetical protein
MDTQGQTPGEPAVHQLEYVAGRGESAKQSFQIGRAGLLLSVFNLAGLGLLESVHDGSTAFAE